MVGTSKILTVSYGTFSCTLEGFDDPFGEMRVIAEYFRDLAAEDRYFGAEPPTPDTDMLARIAQAETQKRIVARADDTGVVVRQEAPVPAVPAESRKQKRLREKAGAKAVAKARVLEEQPAAAAAAAPESIAVKLSRIRAAVARSAASEEFVEDQPAGQWAGLRPISSAFANVAASSPEAAASPGVGEGKPDDVPEDPIEDTADLARLDGDEAAEAEAFGADEAEPTAPATAATAEVEAWGAGAPVEAAEVIPDAWEVPAVSAAEPPEVEENSAEASVGVATAVEPRDEEAGAGDAVLWDEDATDAPTEAETVADAWDEDEPAVETIAGTSDEDADADAAEAAVNVESVIVAGTSEEDAGMADAEAWDEDAAEVPDEDIEAVAAGWDADAAGEPGPALLGDGAEEAGVVIAQDMAPVAADAPAESPPEEPTAARAVAEDLTALFDRLGRSEQAEPAPAPEPAAEPAVAPRLVRARIIKMKKSDFDRAVQPDAEIADAGADEGASAADFIRSALAGGFQMPAAMAPAEDKPEAASAPDVEFAEEIAAATGPAPVPEPAVEAPAPADRAADASFAPEASQAAPAEAEVRRAVSRILASQAPAADSAAAANLTGGAFEEEAGAPVAVAAPVKLADEARDEETAAPATDTAAPVNLADEAPVEGETSENLFTGDPGTPSSLSEEDEAELREELAEVEREVAEIRKARDGKSVLAAHRSAESSVTRILRETETQLDDTAASRRRATIAHLKAAVAATRADRDEGEAEAGRGEEEDLDRYRDDLDRVVRPRRPGDGRTVTTPRRLAPLMLVSEQRIDLPKGEVPGADVRPRRITAGNLALLDEADDMAALDLEEDGDRDGETGPIGSSTAFAEYATRVGAVELIDLLEAAAAYSAFVEGRPSFTRPTLMKQVNGYDFSREDGLRAFGTLLRQGKIQKLKRGHFAIARTSRFRPDRPEI